MGREGVGVAELLFQTKASDQRLLHSKATVEANEVLGAAGLQAAGSRAAACSPAAKSDTVKGSGNRTAELL